MKHISILILSLFILQISILSQSNYDDCTIGVAAGSATQDGRPLAWKTRDFDYENMKIKYNTYGDYNFILVSGAGMYPTTGLNEHGLVIFKSNTYDLTAAPTGPGNQQIQEFALGYCKTIDEFQDYMDSTNTTGRSATGNFALIDSTGAAAIFEVAGYEYWRFNAEDEPNGYIIRTNFTVNGGGNNGIQRFDRSSSIISDYYSGDSLSYQTLLRYHMRDFSDYASQPIPIPFLGQVTGKPFGYFYTYYSICRNNSVSAAVVQGVLPDEKPELSTLWAMLGQPAVAIAVPYWPVGQPPQVSSGPPTAPLCNVAKDLKDLLFDLPDDPLYINSHLLRDTIGGGIWTSTFPTENLIMDSTEVMLNQWRMLDSIPTNDMLSFENEMAELAYNDLTECYNSLTTNIDEPIHEKIEFNIYPNPANHHVNILVKEHTIDEVVIYTLTGQQVYAIRPTSETINISSLRPGMYIVEVMAEGRKVRRKLLVE